MSYSKDDHITDLQARNTELVEANRYLRAVEAGRGLSIGELVTWALGNHAAQEWPERSIPEDIALMHSELSEALEEYRNGKSATETYYNADKPDKPEGIPSEMADVVIRVAQFCGSHGIDLDLIIRTKLQYNSTRGIRHGGKVI